MRIYLNVWKEIYIIYNKKMIYKIHNILQKNNLQKEIYLPLSRWGGKVKMLMAASDRKTHNRIVKSYNYNTYTTLTVFCVYYHWTSFGVKNRI